MNLILMFLLILGLNLSRGQDIVCRRGRLSKKIKIGEGASFSFNTQDDSKAFYAPKTKCAATYKKQRSCPKMTFSCSEFDLKNNDAKICKKGDRMILKIGDQKTSYCQKNGPSVEVISGSLRVSFTSNARKQAAGAKCTISCVEETDTTTTMAPTSETTTLTSTPTSEPGSLTRKELSDYPRAVCNDGSNATYYYSDNAFSADHLLIYLQGGGSCQDVQSCNQRCNNPDSAFRCTAPQDETMPAALNFLLEDEDLNPPFYDFGKIYVPYCSSDIWIGTADASPENGNRFFHGKDIVRALVDDLKKVTNIAGMSQIVLLGTSAGGFGTQNVCDFVSENFKADNPNLDVRCIADSGDLVPPVGLNCTSEVDAQSFWGGESDDSCMDAGAACGNFVTLYNYIETPLMVVHNYIDPTVSGQCAPALDASNIDYWNQWRQEIETP